MIQDPRKYDRFYRVSAKALIVNEDNMLLLVKDGKRGWDLPGGGLESGETPRLALDRELQEELGYSGDVESRPSLIASWRNSKTNYLLLVIIYKVTINEKVVEEANVVKNTKYVSFDEYVEVLDDPAEADWVSDMDFDYASSIKALIMSSNE